MPADVPSGSAQERLDVLARLLAEEGVETSAAAPPPARRTEAPLSFAQEVLWLLDRASPGMTAYNAPVARRIRGALDVRALQTALDGLVARHEALRSVIEDRGEHAVVLVRNPEAVPIALRDVRAVSSDERENVALGFLRELAQTPFDLTSEPPLRVGLVHVAADDHILLLLTHHIASDAWSYGIMFRELSTLYSAALEDRSPALPPVRWQMSDYALRQRELMRGDALEQRLAYWREALSGAAALDMPTDRVRGTRPAFAGSRRTVVLPPALLKALKALAQSHGATLYVALLATYQTLLHRCSGQDDIVVGSAVAARTRSETEGLVGYLSPALPMRTSFDGDPTFAELLLRVREVALGAFEHQDAPLAGDAAPFHVVLTMQTALHDDVLFGTASSEPLELDVASTKFDLTLLASERASGLELTLWFRTDLYEAESAERFLAQLERIVAQATENPQQRVSEIDLLTSGDFEEFERSNETVLEFAAPSVPAQFAAVASRAAQRTAVVCGSDSLTYAQLDAASNRIAQRLRVLGVHAGTPVGLFLERSTGAIAALLGIWKAGGAYVPLPPELPAARLATQLEESATSIVVTNAAWEARVPRGISLVVLDREESDPSEPETRGGAEGADGAPGDVAYIVFTSGSTGVPKGVAVTHGNLANYVSALTRRLALEDDEPLHFATVSSLGADLGNTAIFPALCSGGTLHVIEPEVATDPARFADALTERPVDVLKITPSHLGALLASQGASVLPRRWLVLGGEACSWELVERVRRAGPCAILNHYGPTETTVGACTFAVHGDVCRPEAATVPIGRPLANVRAYVLDGARRPVPRGIRGELFVGGAGVALGYVNRPELTAERFLPDPWCVTEGARMYRTGDRVRRLRSGELEFLGRFDGQVKIRGYRVELAEIEKALGAHAAIAQAAAALVTQPSGERSLAAYVVPKAGLEGAPLAEEHLRAWLAECLPDYMLPASFTTLERLPLTPSGKLNRAALPAPGDGPGAGAADFVEPHTPTEVAVAEIWAEVLKKPRVGARDAFFALGGHSILAIRVLGRISRRFGVRLSLRTLFDAPTVSEFAAAVDRAAAKTVASQH